MEEKINGKFEFVEQHYQFPKIINVNYIRDEDIENEFILVIESPFANCQTFSIMLAYKLCHLNKDEIIDLFSSIFKRIARKQLVIDLKGDAQEEVLEALKFITKNKYSMPYTSTNGSEMNLNIIQLDIDKLK